MITGDGEGFDIAMASAGTYASMQDLYAKWPEFAEWAAAEATSQPSGAFDPNDLEAPSPAPRQVFAVGLNYLDHISEAGLQVPDEPAVFTKFVSSLAGPHCDVILPSGNVDWEVELVVVIGKVTRTVKAQDAWSHVAGLTVGQDISERDLQLVGNPAQFSLGKSFPGFAPTGPVLVTPDEFDNPSDLEIGCYLNGEQMQKARTSQLVFPIDMLIEKLSAVLTLYPGDIIFTGTPAGVGAVQSPPRYINAGDELVSYIEGIGRLTQNFRNSSSKRMIG